VGVSSFVLNDVWGVEIAAEMTFLAIGSFSAVLAFLSFLEGRRRDALIGGLLGVVFPLIALGILNLHLLKPEAAYLVFTSFQPRSWMAIGAVGIVVLLLTSAIFTVLLMLGKSGVAAKAIGLIASLAGIFVATYTGLVLSYERGIPFWHSAIIPMLGLLMGVTGGLSAYSIIRPGDLRITSSLGVAMLLNAAAFLIHIHLSSIGPAAAKYSAGVALTSPVFMLGILVSVVGGLLGMSTFRLRSHYAAVTAAVLGLLAIATLRYTLLASGAWEFPLL
jgi:formate-dependent nitrite reductase membrane component NrfD